MTQTTTVPTGARTTVRRPTVLGPGRRAAVLTAAALLVAGTVISPAADPESATYLAEMADSSTRAGLGGLFFLLGHMLLVPGILALSAVGRLAGAVALVVGVAAVPFAGLGLVRLFEVALARAVEPAVGEEVLAEFGSMPMTLLAILPAVAALNLGLIALTIALWRRGLLAVWPALTAVVGIAGVFVGGDGTPVGVVGSLLLGATVVGLSLTRPA